MTLIDKTELLQNIQKHAGASDDDPYSFIEDVLYMINNAKVVDAVKIMQDEREYEYLQNELSKMLNKRLLCGRNEEQGYRNGVLAAKSKLKEVFYRQERKYKEDHEIDHNLNPCRGCDDYDVHDGCKSNGACACIVRKDGINQCKSD